MVTTVECCWEVKYDRDRNEMTRDLDVSNLGQAMGVKAELKRIEGKREARKWRGNCFKLRCEGE